MTGRDALGGFNRGTIAAESLIEEGYGLHIAGDLNGAERLYLQALSVKPKQADALHFLGLIRAQSERFDEAVVLLEQAVNIRPDFDLALYNLGNALRRLRRFSDAAKAFEGALQANPGAVAAWVNLGATRRELQDLEGAISAYRHALRLKPNDPEALYNLGCALQRSGDLEAACASYRNALSLKPDHADALGNLGGALLQLERPGEAAAVFNRRLALDPNAAEAHAAVASAYTALGAADLAEAAARSALALCADDPANWTALGQALRELGEADGALKAFLRAADLGPDNVGFRVNLAIALQEAGQIDEAVQTVDTALAMDRGSSGAWSVRSGLKRFKKGDPDAQTLRSLIEAADPADVEGRILLEFALGKALMDMEEIDEAFAHLAAGNTLHRARLDYDAAADIAAVEAACSALEGAPLLGANDPDNGSERAVFIVGMPRSGTTLVEQIIASHPSIHGAGELATLQRLVMQIGAVPTAASGCGLSPPKLPATALHRIGEAYLTYIRARAPTSARVTDKMPSNFRLIGVILHALPQARIIHCRRDPMDTCFSCYAAKFTRGQAFAYDLQELGAYYRAYENAMTYWRAHAPAGRFIEVDYEAIVDDLETQARRLIEFCDVPWSDACLTFHETRRQVRTASVTQVRQPLYRTSVGRWKPYDKHLALLAKTLSHR